MPSLLVCAPKEISQGMFFASRGFESFINIQKMQKCCLGIEEFWKAVSFIICGLESLINLQKNMKTLVGTMLFIVSVFESFISLQNKGKCLLLYMGLKSLFCWGYLRFSGCFFSFCVKTFHGGFLKQFWHCFSPWKFHGRPKTLSFFSCAPDWHGMVCYLKRWTPQRTNALWEVLESRLTLRGL